MSRRSAVGLDIGTSGVRAAQVSSRRGTMTLERFGQLALPLGAVQSGEMADAGTVTDAVRELWRATRFTSKDVVLGVSNGNVIVRPVDLPWLPPAQLKTSLKFQVQDSLPMNVDDAILDFHQVSEFIDDSGARMVRGLLVAASRAMVTGLVAAVEKAGLNVDQVDLTSFALLRSVARIDHLGTSERVEALIEVGASVTNIIIHVNGVPRFVRLLSIGGHDVTEAVADRLGSSFGDAEARKQSHLPHTVPDSEEGRAARAISKAASAFADEVRGSFDYYAASSVDGRRVERIVLTGGGARLYGLAEQLAEVTHLPVDLGRGFDTLAIGDTGLTNDQLAYVSPLAAVSVGLALGAIQ